MMKKKTHVEPLAPAVCSAVVVVSPGPVRNLGTGEQTAVWPGDQIRVLDKIGSRRRCRVTYQHGECTSSFTALIPKKWLHFPNVPLSRSLAGWNCTEGCCRLVRRIVFYRKFEDRVIMRWQEKIGRDIPWNRDGDGSKFKNGWKWHQKTLPLNAAAIREWHRQLLEEAVYL